ncbi:hypothetical protein [Anaerolentibacter hominis]|uniref:hypothetical protein n=1 Tax=Anaerolentibacter hominis TaxID=3079009 RepID=UPI0031B8AEDB
MNRFKRRADTGFSKHSVLLPVLLLLCVLFLFVFGLNRLSGSDAMDQKRSIEESLNRMVVHCYAVEGIYPPSLSYLEEHYGFTYNAARFYVDYQPIGSNIFPDITVIPLEDVP